MDSCLNQNNNPPPLTYTSKQQVVTGRVLSKKKVKFNAIAMLTPPSFPNSLSSTDGENGDKRKAPWMIWRIRETDWVDDVADRNLCTVHLNSFLIFKGETVTQDGRQRCLYWLLCQAAQPSKEKKKSNGKAAAVSLEYNRRLIKHLSGSVCSYPDPYTPPFFFKTPKLQWTAWTF